jgi:hypothetical protein
MKRDLRGRNRWATIPHSIAAHYSGGNEAEGEKQQTNSENFQSALLVGVLAIL